MTMNFTLITSIVLTAALATAGTYYVTTTVKPTAENPVETTAVQQPQPQTATQPVTVAVNKEINKPAEVIVKTEVIQKESKHRRTNYIAEGIAARNKPQPHLEVFHQ